MTNPIARDLATLTAIGKLLDAHPGLPPLSARRFDDDGMMAIPYLATKPVTALRAWVEAIEADHKGRVVVRATAAPGGDGTQFTARATLDGNPLALTVVTWRPMNLGATDRPITRDQLRKLVAAEHRNDGQPDDPATAHVVPVEPNPSLTVPVPPRVNTLPPHRPAWMGQK